MAAWTFAAARSLVCGAGSGGRNLGAILRGAGASRVLVVSDPGVSDAGLLNAGLESIRHAGLSAVVYAKTEADPADRIVLEATQVAKDAGSDTIVGFGGGSSMDVAKLVALLASPRCQQPLSEMYGVGACVGERLRLVQIPTTAGTGSEVTPISILTTGANQKKGVVSPQLLPDLSLLDEELTASLPPHVAAATGIDAMVHALEAYTSQIKKNPLSDLLACEALRLFSRNIHEVCLGPAHSSSGAREAMLLGSCLAGMAFANAPVGAVHALAYPLGTQFKVPHGLSVSLMLPHVMRFNAQEVNARNLYATVAPALLPGFDPSPPEHNRPKARYSADHERTTLSDALIDYFERLPNELGIPTTLTEVGVRPEDVDRMAAEAMLQTRLLPNNPRAVGEDDAAELYIHAL